MGNKSRLISWTEGGAFVLLFLAIATIQVLIGGTRMVFSLPAYSLLGGAALLAFFSWRQRKPLPSQVCLAVTLVFLAYILARAFLSPEQYITRSDVYSVLGGLTVYLLTACVFTESRSRMWLLALLLTLALVHVLVGAIQFHEENNFMPISWLQRYDYEWRASGLYVCPNHLAGLLEVLGVMGLSIVCWSRWPVLGKLLVGYAVAVCYVGLILTGSRGGYLSTVTSLGVFAILSLAILRGAGGKAAWKIGGLAALVGCLLLVAAVFYVSKSDLLKERAQNTFETTNMRIYLWKSALQQWQLQPVFGTGTGTFLYYGRLLRDPMVQRDPVYVHNDYLHLLAEYGLVGALGMAAFLLIHLRVGLRNFARLGPKRVAVSQRTLSNALALNVGALAAVSSYLVHSIFDFNLHIPANVLLMAFVFGLLASEGVMRGDAAPAVPRSQMVWRLALPALGVILLVQCARLLPGEYFSERARMAVRDHHSVAGLLYALRGLEWDPQNPDLYYRLGTARTQLGDASDIPEAAASFYDAAIEALKRARALAPREQIYALELASVLDSTRRFDEANAVYQDAIRLDPKSESLRGSYEGHLQLWRGKPAAESVSSAPQAQNPAP